MIKYTPYFDQILFIADELSVELSSLISEGTNDDGALSYCGELAKCLTDLLKEHKYNLDKAKAQLDFVFTHAHDKRYPEGTK